MKIPAPNYYEVWFYELQLQKNAIFFKEEERRHSTCHRSPHAHTHTHTERARAREREREETKTEEKKAEAAREMMEQARTTNERGKGESSNGGS